MDIEIIFRIAAVGQIVAVLNQVLSRSGKEEYTMITTLAGLIAVLMIVLPSWTGFPVAGGLKSFRKVRTLCLIAT